MINIDTAKQEDLGKIVALCLKRGEEFNFEMFPQPDIDVIARNVVKNFNKAPCFVLKSNNEIIGFLGLTISDFFWSDELYLSDYMAYVLPMYRDIDIVEKLYKAAQDYADLQGMPLHLFYIAVDRQAARRRLMRRFNFKETGFLLSYKGEDL